MDWLAVIAGLMVGLVAGGALGFVVGLLSGHAVRRMAGGTNDPIR